MGNEKLRKMTYAGAGVDIDAATEAKQRIRRLARETFTPGVLTDIGSFGALYQLDKSRWRDPLLVSSCDGVGTKLKVAFITGIHNTVGYDLVSHCVSDIMVQGARPLFFSTILPAANLSRGSSSRSYLDLPEAVRKPAARSLGVRRRRCLTFMPPASTTSRDSSWAL